MLHEQLDRLAHPLLVARHDGPERAQLGDHPGDLCPCPTSSWSGRSSLLPALPLSSPPVPRCSCVPPATAAGASVPRGDRSPRQGGGSEGTAPAIPRVRPMATASDTGPMAAAPLRSHSQRRLGHAPPASQRSRRRRESIQAPVSCDCLLESFVRMRTFAIHTFLEWRKSYASDRVDKALTVFAQGHKRVNQPLDDVGHLLGFK